MRVVLTRRAARDLGSLPPRIQSVARKQFEVLAKNIRHPSLRAKKYLESEDLWQGRVNRDYRFYFRIVGDEYRVQMIIPHPK
jgi:mRNA-degrading endonuclease RelE of RelBE toxin-antitoxin system